MAEDFRDDIAAYIEASEAPRGSEEIEPEQANYHAIAELFGSMTIDGSDPDGPSKLGNNASESKQLGEMSLAAGRFQEAITHFRRAVEQKDPNDVEARIDLAGALESSDQFPQAYRQYEKALKIKADASEPRVGLADLYKRYGRFQESIDELRSAIEVEPKNAFYHYKLAETLREAGFPKQALTQIGEAVIIKPDDSFFHYWTGDLQTHLGRYDEALQSLRAAVELSPGDDFLYLRCSVPFWRLGMKVEAIKAVRLASDLEPEKHLYHGLLEELLRANGQNEEADLETERASQMDRYDDEELDRLLTQMGVNL
jgi:tetratricopeptide (TPR) repeat protein